MKYKKNRETGLKEQFQHCSYNVRTFLFCFVGVPHDSGLLVVVRGRESSRQAAQARPCPGTDWSGDLNCT